MRKIATLMLVTASLAVGLAACGSSSSGHESKFKRAEAIAWCAVSAITAYHEYKEHKLGWTAFTGLLAVHNCKDVFAK
jgi:hypothetical protein